MKIKANHYEHIKQAIIAIENRPTVNSYRIQGLSDRRYRWDMLYLANLSKYICDNLYSYMGDEHIDTALRMIFKELDNIELKNEDNRLLNSN